MSKKYKELGKVLRELRINRNITQDKLAEMIEKSSGAVGQFERGETYPGYETLSKIIEVFDVDANIFFFRKSKKYPNEAMRMADLLLDFNDDKRDTLHEFFSRLANTLNNSNRSQNN